MAKKKKFYVVWEGHETGVFDSWAVTQRHIKNYPGARYKSFPSKEAAEDAYHGNSSDFIGQSAPKKNVSATPESHPDIVWDSIAVDAACSGNPGKMEYQGVDTSTGDPIFHQAFELGTNNIGEFLAIVHALAMFKKLEKETPIYTDSKIAMGWVKARKCRTKLERSARTAKLYQVIQRAEKWLKENTFSNPILKWDTENWGEIPADFGRK
ncbi:MAG: ribonuclease H family protein [Saprospiraceae bacterium]|nr:ribonuclease H family protein [Saprospiraceae bacterium]